jgi:peptidoglycan/LPS O-acetylase OafA/YrhL
MTVAPIAATTTHRPHFAALDALRGWAALSVVLYHVPWMSIARVSGYARSSYLMVDIFFVLSGFVITYAYGDALQTPRRIGRYLWLRFWRLYPVHLVFLLVAAAGQGAKYLALSLGAHANYPAFQREGISDFFCNLAMLQSGHICSQTFNRPSWSVSAEFLAYIVFALLVFALRGRARWLASALIVLAGLAFLARSDLGLIVYLDDGWARGLTGFFLGALTFHAYGALRPWASRHGRAIGWAAVAVLLLFVCYLQVGSHSRFDLLVYPLSVLLVLLVALAPKGGPVGFLHTRPMQWLGAISYSLYMAHYMVMWAALAALRALTHVKDVPQQVLPVSMTIGNLALLAALALSLGVSYLVHVTVEKPWRDWSRRTRLLA